MERRELLKLGLVGAAILALPAALHAAKKPLRVFAHDKIDLVVMTADLGKKKGRSIRSLEEDHLKFRYIGEFPEYRVQRFHREDGNYVYVVTTPCAYTIPFPPSAPQSSSDYVYGTMIVAAPGKDFRKVREEIVEALREHRAHYCRESRIYTV